MRRAALLLAALAVPATGHAQTSGAGPSSGNSSIAAPRNADGGTSGTLPRNRSRMDNTVDRIDSKLLNEEKDRPNIPGQAPSPSQTLPGGSASSPSGGPSAGSASPH